MSAGARQPAAFTFEVRPYDDPDVVRLVEQVQAEYVGMYGGPDGAAVALDEFAPPGGLFVVGVLDGDAVATGGWRRHGDPADGVAEIKRMYVVPDARRSGVARALLGALEDAARAHGYLLARLDTGARQPHAQAFYESVGYRRVANFNDNPAAAFHGEKRLASPSR